MQVCQTSKGAYPQISRTTPCCASCKQTENICEPQVSSPRESCPLSRSNHVPFAHFGFSYNDFSQVPAEKDNSFPTSVEKMTFSQKIYHILQDETKSGMIAWMPHGRAFKVFAPKTFEREVLTQYFPGSHFSRFTTQLRKHGFKLITRGIDAGCFYHEVSSRWVSHSVFWMYELHSLNQCLSSTVFPSRSSQGGKVFATF